MLLRCLQGTPFSSSNRVVRRSYKLSLNLFLLCSETAAAEVAGGAALGTDDTPQAAAAATAAMAAALKSAAPAATVLQQQQQQQQQLHVKQLVRLLLTYCSCTGRGAARCLNVH